MATNIFDLELTEKQLKAGVNTIDTSDLNRQVAARGEFIHTEVDRMLQGVAQPVVSEAKMVDVSTPANAMKKLGEFGLKKSEGERSVVEINFPLWKWGYNTGWTEDFLLQASVGDFRKSVLDAEYSYSLSLQDEIKAAMYNSVRREFDDRFDTKRTGLIGYPFYNADGQTIPANRAGTTFTASTHQHYNGTSGTSTSIYDIDTLLISNVTEHDNVQGIALFMPQALVATLSGIASTKFVAVDRPNVVYSDAANHSAFVDNLEADAANKLVGHWDGYPVFVRSWCPANIIACVATGAPEKALGFREPTWFNGMRPLAAIRDNVLSAQEWRAYFGMAANNRGAASFLDTATQTTYSVPTLVL